MNIIQRTLLSHLQVDQKSRAWVLLVTDTGFDRQLSLYQLTGRPLCILGGESDGSVVLTDGVSAWSFPPNTLVDQVTPVLISQVPHGHRVLLAEDTVSVNDGLGMPRHMIQLVGQRYADITSTTDESAPGVSLHRLSNTTWVFDLGQTML